MTRHLLIVLSFFALVRPALAAPRGEQDREPMHRHLATSLLALGASATPRDAVVVRGELLKLPTPVLQVLKKDGRRIVVGRGSVTDVMPELHGERPRGWPAGSTWDTVPGLGDNETKRVVIATRGDRRHPHVPVTGEGHGSYNLVLHETLHGYDTAAGGISNQPAFRFARYLDRRVLTRYERQRHVAGRRESFAEEGAKYFNGDSTMDTKEPHFAEVYRGLSSP